MEFLKQFIKNPEITGGLTPSSKELSQLITSTASVPKKRCIVELGSGTGVFTEKILSLKSPGSTFFCLEINQDFVRATRSNCPDAKVYHASAEEISKYLLINNENSCDCIISGLPWASFDLKQQLNLLSPVFDSLEPEGEFLTFSYLHGLFLTAGISFKKVLEKKFSKVDTTKIIWQNLPPALVYHCVK